MQIKTSFELLNDSLREEHPLAFLSAGEKCYAFAKASNGYVYVTRSGDTWKILHVSKRNQKRAKVLWRRHAPNFKIPPTAERLLYFESLLEDGKIKVKKPRLYPKDKQVKKFYDWERRQTHTEIGMNEYCSIVDSIRICDVICRDFGFDKPIKVRYLKQRKNYAYGGYSYGSNIDIIDPNVQTIYHEISHIIHTRLATKLTGVSALKHQAHGKEFAAFYAFIFKKYTSFKTVVESLKWEQIEFDQEIYDKLVELYWEKPDNSIDSESSLNGVSGNTPVS